MPFGACDGGARGDRSDRDLRFPRGCVTVLRLSEFDIDCKKFDIFVGKNG